ncbi:LysR family transcriptional regulator [Sulfitobacter pseudonitzschiae]|uniref:LysR family transcriptional regulator n=1 Tax=Pseudosulfitobacter pseudonitzschiae TaxID=1402135 RepID=A0A9Q2RZ51_9RHOB|nr:LysR family transcriptional regulator [Pseudosulfitobacter pseudonitzschiae]MBM2294338.1 LysR family transcriptional regulator [Pseudosulfitobacter pseudonitzschiae]MBM2299263.1 LysR family transcriptional regulator [Pseudosulfitobacter pseudonitzschiae]MBM2304171.1 LysR family transcriptional regulator [Pseudosulfitobacter pseudonitzschiae]MBM2313951.1 LysR family transcriptional regulator [Pseudosulfitobacter pseudonitzschiae]MBM2318865.1 LysR family transcriptional regulator [Pseudosulfi
MTSSAPHLDRLRLRQLRLLELIDTHRSLRAVGEVMNLTQPAVSQMLKDLEFAFGVTLVDRSVRGAMLSPLGQLALQRARTGLAIFDNLAADLHADLPTVVRVGTNPAVMLDLVPSALHHMKAHRANIRFRIEAGTVGNMMSGLLNGDLDCYVGRVDWTATPEQMAETLRYDPLTETSLVVACSVDHPLANRTSVSATELAQWPWAMPSGDTNNRRSIETAFRNCGVQAPVPVVEVSADPTSLLRLTQRIELLTCLPKIVLETYAAEGRIVPLVTPDLDFLRIQTCFVTLRENDTLQSLQMLREALVHVCLERPDVTEGG